MKVKSESEVAQSCPTLHDPMDCSLPAPLSMGFSRQEYWSGVPLPSPINIYTECISSILACTVPWTEEPGGLQPMGCTNMPEHTDAVTQNAFIDKGIDDIMAKTQAVFVFKKNKRLSSLEFKDSEIN